MFPGKLLVVGNDYSSPGNIALFLERRKPYKTMVKHIVKLVNTYQKKYQWLNERRAFFCPYCNKKMHRHGYYSRMINILGVLETLIYVQRYYCPECRKTCSRLPIFAVKYTAIAVVSIEEIVSNHKADISIAKLVDKYILARSTIKRYISGWHDRYIIGTLEV